MLNGEPDWEINAWEIFDDWDGAPEDAISRCKALYRAGRKSMQEEAAVTANPVPRKNVCGDSPYEEGYNDAAGDIAKEIRELTP
jgi:hypothetical protein